MTQIFFIHEIITYNAVSKELVKDISKPYKTLKMVEFPNLAMHQYLKGKTIGFDSAGLPFYGSWRMKKQKVTMCKKHLFWYRMGWLP